MFTGLVEELATVRSVAPRGESVELSIGCRAILDGMRVGDSIAVDGCCLTAETIDAGGFTAHCSPETMRKTSLGERVAGDLMNVERSLTLATRLGGHMVSGHVDATGTFKSAVARDNSWEVRISAPPEITRRSVAKGSIAVDGISLTLVELSDTEFSLWIIPETWKRTTLSHRRPGQRVNLETDLIGKYVYRFMETRGMPQGTNDERLWELLAQGRWTRG